MKLLHTSDWHVGKGLKGISRTEEHREVLSEVIRIAKAEQVDMAIVAGDLFDSSAPTPEASAVVFEALLALRDTGATVVAIAGNHDHPGQFEALRPLMAAAGITILGRAHRPEDGGVVEVVTQAGETVRLALLPFCSQRHIVKAAQLMAQDAAENAATYDARMRALLDSLTASFGPGTVNVVVAHCTIVGGRTGGGEREAPTIFDYWVDATAFPASVHYVALGHLHRTQRLPGACPIWYSGSPLQVDFGETEETKNVLVIEATATTPATVRQIPLTTGRRLRTVTGTLQQLRHLAGTTGNDVLRVFVNEPARAGLADEVREILPLAVEVRVATALTDADNGDRPAVARHARSPHELFKDFLGSRGVSDERVERLFAELLDEQTTADNAELGAR
jgi:DNA repair protein SbcD/Mre11